MKNVLVVSDNCDLTRYFKEECQNYISAGLADFEFCYSAINAAPEMMIELGLKPINMKSSEVIQEVINKYDLIFSLHCKQIFPVSVVTALTCINVHPGYNPYNRGWYPQVFSIINGLPIGATIHLMDVYVDHGKIIDQKCTYISPGDTSLDIYNRVIELEKQLISENLDSIVNGSFASSLPCEEGNYNSILDFKELCRLNLEHIGSLQEHIDLLRALSHGDFKNAYYEVDGKKYYIAVRIAT